MICCCSPAASNYEITLSSLRFAERAKQVKNVARINVDPVSAKIASLTAELQINQARIASLELALSLRMGLPEVNVKLIDEELALERQKTIVKKTIVKKSAACSVM